MDEIVVAKLIVVEGFDTTTVVVNISARVLEIVVIVLAIFIFNLVNVLMVGPFNILVVKAFAFRSCVVAFVFEIVWFIV